MKLNRIICAAAVLLCAAGCQSAQSAEVPESTPEPQETEAAVMMEDGIAEGQIGQTMQTAFFDFKVNSARLMDEYEGYVPADGYAVLAVNITIDNTLDKELNMYDTDFQITWGDGEDDWGIPLTYTVNSLKGQDLLATAYTLKQNESITGDIVFQVPADSDFYIISYLEKFADDSQGDLFAVYFGLEN